MSEEPRILDLGDSAITVEYGRSLDPAIHRRVMGLNAAVSVAREEGRLVGVIETVPTIRSLTIHYDALQIRRVELLRQLRPVIADSGEAEVSGRRWQLPVCYEDAFAPDLQTVSELTGLSPAGIVDLHGSAEYTVYMLGFMPGFGFLGGLPERLAVPRLSTPRTRVPARSVAITGRTCAIYPTVSPGGWRLIGRTPIEMFELQHPDSPCLLAPGDVVRFAPVSASVFNDLRTKVEAGAVSREQLLAADGGP